MFEAVELNTTVDRETYKRELPELREALLKAQKDLAAADCSVVILLYGGESAGKGEVLHQLLEWLDARGVRTHALWKPTEEERQRPRMWRYWMALPPSGRIAIFFASWYNRPVRAALAGRIGRARFDQDLDRIVEFERMLHREKTLVIKLWLHLSRAALKKKLKKLLADARTRWQVGRRDRRFVKRFDEIRPWMEHTIRRTNLAESPWYLIDAADRRHRNLSVGRTILNVIRARIDQPAPPTPAPGPLPTPPTINVLSRLDLTLAVPTVAYEDELLRLQARLRKLTEKLRRRSRSLIAVFEGPDAAGKGGAIRRLTFAIDPRDFQVVSVAAPTDEERAHPYLWRFWRQLPRQGKVTIYDRSWYGRVLVERIEGFCAPADWQRAYHEINAFEEQLTDGGIIVCKFWLQISPEEQLRRFADRETTPFKQYKITEEDWRNRAKWDAYTAAACDMIEKTSTEIAPWTLVEADNKEWARLKVLRTVAERLKDEL
jgi:polyphosphate:AMP phosphotransferase